MPKLAEILQKERERATIEQCAVIHLFQEGTFYRAYEWSAWLCHRYVKEFKPTHRILKDSDDSIVFVGFPLTSLERYTPEGASVAVAGEKCVDMVLPGGVFAPDADAESLGEEFDAWKQGVPMTEASKKRIAEEQGKVERQPRLTDVMHRILAYPIEQRSPMDCMAFLADIKQQISEII